MRSYCGREQRQEPLRFPAMTAPVSLHIFIVPQKMGIPVTVSPTPLPYTPSCPQWSLARKTVLPTGKLIGASQKGKGSTFRNSQIIRNYMRVKKMTIEEGQRVGISRFPNFHKTGSVRGMKKLYYGADCLLVRCYEKR